MCSTMRVIESSSRDRRLSDPAAVIVGDLVRWTCLLRAAGQAVAPHRAHAASLCVIGESGFDFDGAGLFGEEFVEEGNVVGEHADAAH